MANEKHIFIGIGGQGCKTIAMIKEKVYEKRFPVATQSKSRLQAMNDTYRFLFLDTDQRDIDEANKRIMSYDRTDDEIEVAEYKWKNGMLVLTDRHTEKIEKE